MIGMFWSMLQSENENISFLYSVWLKKKYFKNIKLWIFFFTTKMHWKSSKKKQKKTMILGWAFVIGRDRKKKKYCQIGAFFFFFFTSHLYSNHSLNLIILWFILFSFFCFDRCHEKGVGSKSSLQSANPANSRLSFCRSALTWIWFFWAR